ncbi:acetate--CoA ligase family protein [Sabulicella rubraurantiaca]|uniref:acetate--CoA ligase family protein n=1 Tax=Sabulicella rubraurantiaca TaxID=2811429 RepID=UPI001A97081F|nr:acetate--CoA ligase family protein [Sabulicella rubraurantiaca]
MEKLRSPESLKRLLAPRSVAVIGVSAEPTGFGARTVQNMANFDGPVWCVNPKYAGQELHGRPCYASVDELPSAPDSSVIALPRTGVLPAVEALARKGAGGAVIYASGYGETDLPERAVEEEELRARARELGFPLLGVNCLGFVDHTQRCGATFMPEYAKMTAPAGGVGVVSQSGAMGYALMQAAERGFAMAHMLTAGNSTDLDVCDLAAFQLAMPEVRSIALAVEGLRDARRLLALGEMARAASKPIVVLKLGRGEIGAQAAMSHTGSLAGSTAAWSAGFKRAGMLEVEDFDALLETAGFLAKAPPPKARGVGIVTPSGGAGIMAADHAEFAGLELPQPRPHTAETLRASIPEFGSPRNPCDLTAQVATNPKLFEDCMAAMLEDDQYATVIFPVVYHNPATTPSRMKTLDPMAERSGKPICIMWIPESLEGAGPESVDTAPHLSLFRSTRRMMNAIRLWLEYHDQKAEADAPRVAAPALPNGEATLMEAEAKALFREAGLPVGEERRAADAEAAVRAADAIGYPVVLKLDSPDVAHKTEVGGVQLNLADAAAVRDAFARIMEGVKRHAPNARVEGVLVQRMERRGVELILGARRDPQFGTMLLVGLGGVQAELWKDVALDVAPVSPARAEAMLRGLKSWPLFDGFRGAAKVDVTKVADAIARFSAFAAACGDRLEEVEINPLLCRDDGCVAVDGLMKLSAAQGQPKAQRREAELEGAAER